MARRMEIAGGMIKGIKELSQRLEMSRYEIAVEMLEVVENTYPAPPWNTGALRSSGGVYVGSRLVASTASHGPNPEGFWMKKRKEGGFSKGSVPIPYNSSTFGVLSRGVLGRSSEDKISVVYRHPVAALMHEWRGNFSPANPMAGPHFISAKFDNFGHIFEKVLRRVI